MSQHNPAGEIKNHYPPMIAQKHSLKFLTRKKPPCAAQKPSLM